MIELTTFRLRDGVDEAAFVAADAAAQAGFFYQQPGLARRTTAKGTEDEWLVVTWWGSGAEADAAARALDDPSANAAAQAYLDCRGDRTVRRYEPLAG